MPVTKSWRQLEKEEGVKVPTNQRDYYSGKTADVVTYQKWLKSKEDDFLKALSTEETATLNEWLKTKSLVYPDELPFNSALDILGKERYKLWRSGKLTLTEMAKDNKILTLEELGKKAKVKTISKIKPSSASLEDRALWLKKHNVSIARGLSLDSPEVIEALREIEQFPEKVLTEISKRGKGFKFRIINKPVTSEAKYRRLKGVVPRGWEGTGRTWDDVFGLANDLVLGAPISVKFGYDGTLSTVRHEIGHKIDAVLWKRKKAIKYERVSDDPAFIKLHSELQSKGKLKRYHTQSGAVGRQEFFAEFMSTNYGTKAELDYYANSPLSGYIKNRWSSLGTLTDADMKPIVKWWEEVVNGIK